MATTINASTSAGLVSTADTSGVLQLQAAGTTVLNGELGKALALQGATSTTGCGIAFPATQVASSEVNTLDDYEEGTWTPVLSRTGLTITYTVQNGTYTKIGRQVFAQINLRINAVTGTGSGALALTGWPFSNSFTNYTCGGTVTFASGCGTAIYGIDLEGTVANFIGIQPSATAISADPVASGILAMSFNYQTT